MPQSGFINVLDFPRIKDLADYLKYLDSNVTAYNSYFKWKKYVEFDSTDSTIDTLETNVVKFAGANIVNVELLDRSEPSYVDQLIRMLAASYAQKTDAYALKAAIDGASVSTGTTIYKAIADGIADAYNVMRFLPNRLVVPATGGTEGIDFPAIIGAVDGSARPLFAAVAPSNAAGTTYGSTSGKVAGLDLVVEPNIPASGVGEKFSLVRHTSAPFDSSR